MRRRGLRSALQLLFTVLWLGACAPSGDREGSAAGTLNEASWPTEQLNGEASTVKAVLFDSLSAGRLEPEAVEESFGSDFRGEPLSGRASGPAAVQSGVAIRAWEPAQAELDRETFRTSWNAWIEELGEILTVEKHTWELQLRPGPAGERGLEAKEAIWILARLKDGRLREERLYLIFDLEDRGGWKIVGVRSDQGRTTIAPGPYFHDVTGRSLPPGSDQIGAQIYTDGGPVLADFDDDGDPDLFLPRLHAPARLYENDGRGTFDDVTARRGLELISLRQGSNSGLFLDFDGDRTLDLVVATKEQGLKLFRNDGARFQDVTGEPVVGPGEWESMAAADYDGDGRIDLYLCNYNLIDPDHQPESYVDAWDGLDNVLLRNLGDGSFEDVTEAAGMGSSRRRWSYAATWADYDTDGDLDLYVANDYGANSLFRNRGDGTFEEVASAVGAEDRANGMGVSWVDADGDLDLDLFVSNMQSFAGNRITRLESFPGTAEQQELYRRFARGNSLLANQGDGSFEDVTLAAGVKGAFWAWGNVPLDYDADGDQDLFVCGGFYTGASAKDT